jgi:hypothetical protein
MRWLMHKDDIMSEFVTLEAPIRSTIKSRFMLVTEHKSFLLYITTVYLDGVKVGAIDGCITKEHHPGMIATLEATLNAGEKEKS